MMDRYEEANIWYAAAAMAKTMARKGATRLEIIAALRLRAKALDMDGEQCKRCNGTGSIDTPYSGSDPSCPNCNGSEAPT